jgi:hypothetical protein
VRLQAASSKQSSKASCVGARQQATEHAKDMRGLAESLHQLGRTGVCQSQGKSQAKGTVIESSVFLVPGRIGRFDDGFGARWGKESCTRCTTKRAEPGSE